MGVWQTDNAFDTAIYGLMWIWGPLSTIFVWSMLSASGVLQAKKKKGKSNLSRLGLQKMVSLEAITENQQLSLLVPQYLGCGGKSFMKDTIVFVWSGWMENKHAAEYAACAFIDSDDMFGLQQVVYIVLRWLFATSKIPPV